MAVIALVVGELTAYLTVNKDAYTRGITEARGELNQLARDADRQSTATADRSARVVSTVSDSMSKVGLNASRQGQDAGIKLVDGVDAGVRQSTPRVQRSGEDVGGKLSQGISQGIIRNSPLIVAGIGAALAAGAPVVLTAATTMFAGIGIAAASQNEGVREAFAGLRDLVKDSLDEIGGSVAWVLPGIADSIGASFERMIPPIQKAMHAVAPQVVGLTDSLLQMAENALPGVARAAQNAGPAIEGLGRFLETIGTGIGDFFSDISDHAPAAGAAFDGLGQVVAELLPILSDLIGNGAELAAAVLPTLASGLHAWGAALGVVTDAAVALGPLLPGITAALIGMKTAGVVGGMFTSLGASVGGLAVKLGVADGALGNLSRGLGAIGVALPVVGAVVGILAQEWDAHGNALAANSEKFTALIAAMRQGGAAGEQAAAQLAGLNGIMEHGGMVANLLADAQGVAADAEAARLAALTPLEQAQERSNTTERNLAQAVHDHGAKSDEARGALKQYEAAQRDVAAAAAAEEMALHGVTQAMIDQANQALAAIDSGFAYQNSLNQLEDAQGALAEAQAHLNDSNEDTRTSTEDVERAQLAVAEQSYQTALAFGQQQADLSGLEQGTSEYTRLLQGTTLQELYRLRDAAGPEMAGAIQQQITALEASGVSLDDATVRAGNAAGAMDELGSKRPKPIADLDDTELKVKTDSAFGKLGLLTGTIARPTADMDPNPFNGIAAKVAQTIADLGSQRPTPVGSFIDGVSGPALTAAKRVGDLGWMVARPAAYMWDGVSGPAAAAAAAIGRIQSKTVYINAVQTFSNVLPFADGGAIDSRLFGAATGGSVDAFMAAAQRRDGGGPVSGPGGPTDDLIPATLGGTPFRLSNGEHVLDARDVQLMGGQAGVYRFRELLNAGAIDRARLTSARAMSSGGSISPAAGGATVQVNGDIVVKIVTPMNLTNDRDLRRAGEKLQGVLQDLGRARS